MFAAMLILLVLSIPFILQVSAGVIISAIPAASIFLTPNRVQGTAGETVTIHANITNVNQLLTFAIGFYWTNTAAVSCLSVTDGGFLTKGVPPSSVSFFPGDINNSTGQISYYTWAILGSNYNKTGSGTLVNLTFYMKQTGYSDVHVTSLYLANADGNPIACNTIDYFTAVAAGVQYIVQIRGNPIVQSESIPGGFAAFQVENVSQIIGSVTYKGLLSFSINGTALGSNTFAYFNVTIPNKLMNCSNPDNWVVKLNSTLQGARTVSPPNANNSTISLSFAYTSTDHATWIVQIYSQNTAVPEFSNVFFAVLLVLATFAAALFSITTRSHTRKG
jgi:hypothetical protein